MIPMTKIDGVADKEAVKPGMAWFPATGPLGTTCGDCAHRGYYREMKPRFNQKTNEWEERQRKTGAWRRGRAVIDNSSGTKVQQCG